MRLWKIYYYLLSHLYFVSQHNHDDENHSHEDHSHKNEISIAAGIVPIPAEDEIAAGIHLHYIKGIGESNKFGIGVGLETILDEHKHYTLSAVFQYRIYKGIIIAVAPGLLLRKEGTENVFEFAQHIEAGYEFEIGKIHIGPVVELGFEKNGMHYMGGIHFGIDF